MGRKANRAGRPTTKSPPSQKGALDSIPAVALYASLTGLILLVYLQTMSFGYSGLDDLNLVKDNIPVLGNIANLPALMRQDVFLGRGDSVFYRPFQMASYMLDTVIGGPRPASYHVSNVLLHCAASCSLLYLLLLLRFDRLPAFFFAALFAVHPVFAQSVSWIPSRGDLLIGLFGILAVSFYVKFTESGRLRDLILHALCFFAAIFSKETAVVIPVILFSFWLIGGRRTAASKAIMLPGIFWLVVCSGWFLLRRGIVESSVGSSANLGIESLIANLPAIPVLTSKFFFPIGLSPIPRFTTAGILSGLVVICGLGAWAIVSHRVHDRRLLFGVVWFVVFLLPGLWYRHALGASAYDYLTQRLYLPSVGLIICMLSLTSDAMTRRPTLSVLVASSIIVACSINSAVLARNYSDSLRFYDYAVATNPQSALAHNNRGAIYRINGQLENAISDFDEAIRLLPQYPEPHYGMGAAKLSLGDTAAAEREFSRAIELRPDYADALIGRGLARSAGGDPAAGLSDFSAAISVRPNSVDAYVNRGNTYKSLNQYAEAEADYRAALRVQPDMAPAYVGLGGIRADEGKSQEAMEFLTKALAADPQSADAYHSRGLLKKTLNDYSGALADLNEAIRLAPQSPVVYTSRGAVYEAMDHMKEALRDFEEAISVNPNYPLAYRNRGVIRYKLDDREGACADWARATQLGIPDADALSEQYCR